MLDYNFPNYAQILSTEFRRFSPFVVEKIIETQHEAILDRRARGKDLDNTDSTGYAESTKRIRKRRNLRTDIVTLRFEDRMLNSLRPLVKVGSDSALASLVFGSSFDEDKAIWNQYGTKRGIPPREFFGFSDTDVHVQTGNAYDMANNWIMRLN